MSQTLQLKEITGQLQTQFRNIAESSGYFNTMYSSHVVKNFEIMGKAIGYPSIYVASVKVTDERQMDQVTYLADLEIEVFGYLQAPHNADVLDDTMELADDMEKAIISDETLGDRVHGLGILTEVSAYHAFGVAYLKVRCQTTYTK